MKDTTLYIGPEYWRDDPESEDSWIPLVQYNPRDLRSVRKAQLVVKERFKLDHLPLLCNNPQTGLFRTAAKTMRTWLERRRFASPLRSDQATA